MSLRRTYLQAQVVEAMVEYALDCVDTPNAKDVYSRAFSQGRELGYCFYILDGSGSRSAFVANHRNTDEYFVICTTDKIDWDAVSDEEWKAKLFFPAASPGDATNCILQHLGFPNQAFY